ncbi:uncharacterized protein I303_101713 [Kwoniella dejecticola CBS 10117]|uniref:TAP42-like protein n=1 Tax=Kwoniella dejecticola CBS 10117 TaxID=1296121 RepID=A0A1A6AD03_9TREE|nr:uncharacterized protein I303_02151 [Kwoniella dejecticola CBS 10117]OBR87935.1 hypothetical protein I303_02151 [Kwoniella dejecticola CBS 10117]
MSTNLPLPQFYAQTLSSLQPIFDDTLSTSDPKAQGILSSALDNLYLIQRMVNSLGVFSENENVDEVGEKELVFMSLGWVIGATEEKGGLGGRDDRMSSLQRAETAYSSYLELLTSYSVLSPEDKAESSASTNGGPSIPKDPAKKREAKIAQYRKEKDLRQYISNSLPSHPDTSSSPITFLLDLLPSTSTRPSVVSTSTGSTSVNPDDAPEITKSTIVLILRLLYTSTLSSLSSISMELDLLSNAPASISQIAEQDPRHVRREEEDATWRLDRQPGTYKPRELISGNGKVLRPFTILPSTQAMSDRERLKGDVFKQSWRLPTMTIDEYLEEEQRRGNIITGGGQASYDAPTATELMELEAENDGTIVAEENYEKKRLKDENWAMFTDENKKGAGNTMNKG